MNDTANSFLYIKFSIYQISRFILFLQILCFMSLSASLLKFSRLLYFNCIQHSWDLSIISVSDNSSNYNNQKVCAVSEDANQC